MKRGRTEQLERPRAYDSQDERDQASEAHYTCDRLGEASILAMVMAYQGTLVQEFWAWLQEHHYDRERPVDALERWEHQRFGDALFPAAHGVLKFAVRQQTAPTDRWQPKRPVLDEAQRQRAFDEALGRMAREHEMEPRSEEMAK